MCNDIGDAVEATCAVGADDMDSPTMNPLVRHGQERRPTQPIIPLNADEIASCESAVNNWLSANRAAPYAVMTYLTDVATPWVLGLSAAHYNVPLIVVGHGMRWGGAGVKLPAARRAAQVLAAHAPASLPIVFADGSDTAVANALSRASALLLSSVRRDAAVVVSGECNSWPLCYRSLYNKHEAFRSCAASRSSACYPNSGLYCGRASSLLTFLRSLERRASRPGLVPPERGDDQAAMHSLYLEQRSNVPPSDNLEIRVDSKQALFGGLHACKGAGVARTLSIKNVTFSMCHEGAHEPLRGLRQGTGASSSSSSSSLTMADGAAPLLVHASGNHDRLARAFLGETAAKRLNAVRGPTPLSTRTAALDRSWRELFARSSRNQVLMIDSAANGSVCTVVSM